MSVAAALIAGTANNTTTSEGTTNSRPLVAGRHIDVTPDRVSALSAIQAPTAATTPNDAHTVSANPGRSTPRPAISHTPTVRVSNQPATANPLTATTALATARPGRTNNATPVASCDAATTTKMVANSRWSP